MNEEEFQAILDADAGQERGTSSLPSDNAFELPWHEGDQAWAWLDAIYAAEMQEDPTRLLQLLSASAAPANAMPFIKDLFDRTFGPRKHIKGPKVPLWQPSLIERGALLVDHLVKQEGLTVAGAVDRVLKDYPNIAADLAREKPNRRKTTDEQKIPHDKLKDYYSSGTGDGHRKKKRRPSYVE